MARYPTFEEYRVRGNYQDGIKRCDEFLKKNPSDVQLLTVKLQLLYASKFHTDSVLQQLLSIQPPIRDLRELVAIEDAVASSQKDVFPQPHTAGPSMSKLWDNACKAFSQTDHKVDLLSVRFSRAIVHNRIVDAQQALIQYKALQPKNRMVYMAHAALTQLLSVTPEDIHSRLALSLARKAVSENFDEDKSLDCRVAGQIFALQGSTKDLETIGSRRFMESKQVYDALRRNKAVETNGLENPRPSSQSGSVAPAEWLETQVKTLRNEFRAMVESSAPLETMLAISTALTQLYHAAATRISVGNARVVADACFLSISAWVRSFELTGELRYLLLASFLAESLLKLNTNIHEARLILVYLYMRLGLGSLAMHAFESLSVKEIQHDTVGHALFTRLSLTHPHETNLNKSEVFDPSKRTAKALSVYTRHEEKLSDTEAGVLNHGQTGMIFDVRELRNRLRSSLARRIIILENRRIARLFHDDSQGDPTDLPELSPRMTANWLAVTDNRDFAGTFDYGYNVEKVLHGRKGGLPGTKWILYSLAADSAWCLATGHSTAVVDIQNLLQELEAAKLNFEHLDIKESGNESSGLSDAETLAFDLAYYVLKLLVDLTEKPTELSYDIDSALSALKRLQVEALWMEALWSTKAIFAEQLSDLYTYLDILGIVVKASQFASKRTMDCEKALTGLLEYARDDYNTIQKHARQQIESIDASKIMTYLQQESTVHEITKPFGEGNVEVFCKSVASSAWEGWNGLTRIQLV